MQESRPVGALPDSVIRAELMTKILFFKAMESPASADEVRHRFFSNLRSQAIGVPLFGKTSSTWQEYLQYSLDEHYVTANGQLSLTEAGRERLAALELYLESFTHELRSA